MLGLNEEIFMVVFNGTGYGFSIGSIIAIAIFGMIVIEGYRLLKKGFKALKNLIRKQKEKDIILSEEGA